MIKWSDHNSKLVKTGTLAFGIPAGVAADGFDTCPAKGVCAGYCYARQGFYAMDHVQAAREHNLAVVRASLIGFVAHATAELAHLKPDSVRVHDSGDFFSADYLDAWFSVARALPLQRFYAYTKMFHGLATRIWSERPRNFQIIQSVGGRHDAHVDYSKPHARVFVSHEERTLEGYVDGSEDDGPAMRGEIKIGLVYHGSKGLTDGQYSALSTRLRRLPLFEVAR